MLNNEKSIVIYRAYFPDGKSYVGQSVDFDTRKKTHERAAKSACDVAIQEFGKENVVWIFVERCDTREHANERERYWIAAYDSYYNGYNETLGGSDGTMLGRKHKPETIAKMKVKRKGRKPRLGIPFTEEGRQNVSRSCIGKPKKPHNKRKWTEADRKKRAMSRIRNGKHISSEMVARYSLQTYQKDMKVINDAIRREERRDFKKELRAKNKLQKKRFVK